MRPCDADGGGMGEEGGRWYLKTLPSSGRSLSSIRFSSVDLPAPFGPTIPDHDTEAHQHASPCLPPRRVHHGAPAIWNMLPPSLRIRNSILPHA